MPTNGDGSTGRGTDQTNRDGGGRSRRSYLKAATAVGATGLAGCLGSVPGFGGGGPIKVGMAFPYTGPYGASAEKQRDGVNLAVQEINENGGLLGRDLETYDRDTELNPNVNARRIRELLHEENVDLLVANLSGGITTQTQSLAKDAGVPYMAGSRTSPPFHYPDSLGEGSYAPAPLNIEAIVTPIKGVFEQELGNSFYAAIADYGFNRPEAWEKTQEYINAQGGEIRGSVFTPLGNKDFSSVITEAMDSGADVMLAMVYGLDFANFMQQAGEFGLREEMEIVNPVQSQSFLAIAGDMSIWEDVYFGMSWHPTLMTQDSQAKKFADKFKEEFGYAGESFGAITYTGMKEFGRAVSESGGLSTGDIAGVLDGSTFSSYIMEGETKWRACDNQALNPGYLFTKGKKAEAMGERGPWDVVDILANYDPTEFLPDCSYFEQQQG